MDVEALLSSLLDALADRPFVQSVDVETEAIVRRGRVLRERDRFLQVYVNEETGTTAFALIEDQHRIRGVDSDDLRGEHVHSVDFPDQHRDIDPMTLEEIVEPLADACEQLLEPMVQALASVEHGGEPRSRFLRNLFAGGIVDESFPAGAQRSL